MKQRLLYILALLFATMQTFAQTYTYDKLNRLEKVVYENGVTVTYSYDALGNRTSKKVTGGHDAVVTAMSYSLEYGDTNPSLEFTVSGEGLNGTPDISCDATTASKPGQYTIEIDKGTVTNKDVTFVNGTLTITKAPLTITAKSYNIRQGEALPKYEITYSGFKNGETNKVLKTQPKVTCSAKANSKPGTYDIIVSGATADNYEISYVKGTLRIRSRNAATGDINDDGEVDVTDVVELIDMVLTGSTDAAGDINGDGEVDVTDVVELIDIVLAG